MRKLILTALAAVVVLTGVVNALDLKKKEMVGAQRTYFAKTSVASTHTVTGILMYYQIFNRGSGFDYSIKHSTNQMNLNDGTSFDPNINISSTVFMPSTVTISVYPQGMMINPIISIDRLDGATTVYIQMDYLVPRFPGEF